MKTLERFWQWYDAESPEAGKALSLSSEHVSGVARFALSLAASLIDCRQDPSKSLGCSFCDRDMLEKYPQALRDLSLALCPALEAMYAAVPEGEAKPLPWIPLAHPDPYEFRMITGAEILANARALRERTAMQNDMFARAIELYDPFLSPPKHVRNRCVRSLEAQAEHAKCTRLLGPAECFECQSSPCRWSAGGWPEPGFAEDMRIIHINPDLDLNGCDALRGSSGVLVRLAGQAADYNQAVLRYLLLDVLDPGHIATTYADPEFGRRWEIWKAERVDVEIRNSAEAARRP